MTVDLVDFNALPDLIRASGRRTILRLSTEGRFPPFVRLTPHKPMWSRRAVAKFLADKLAPLTPAADTPSSLIESFDGEPTR